MNNLITWFTCYRVLCICPWETYENLLLYRVSRMSSISIFVVDLSKILNSLLRHAALNRQLWWVILTKLPVVVSDTKLPVVVSDIEPPVVMWIAHCGSEKNVPADSTNNLLNVLNKTSNVTTNNEEVICEIDYKQEQQGLVIIDEEIPSHYYKMCIAIANTFI
jgi:hypothetical protein